MSVTKTNTGYLYQPDGVTEISTADAHFTICDPHDIVLEKEVDRPDSCYFSGDTIVFTITILSTASILISDVVLKDTIDSSVIPLSGNEFDITTTSGTVVSSENPIEITGIQLEPEVEVIVTITGKIA